VPRGVVLVLAGPSGTGKGSIGKRLVATVPGLQWSVSWATRTPREGEVDGVDYVFVSRDAFEAEQARGGFLESFDVYGDLKGTPRRPVLEHAEAGRDVLVEVDVQGALEIKRQLPEAVLVFVMPPSREAQRERFLERAGDDAEQLASLERRLAAAHEEEAAASQFDHVVVNDDLSRATAEVAAILDRHRTR
jgi:guanylate kinase